MPKQIRLVDGSVWQPKGGRDRRYENVATGETLSRRQFDKRSERLGAFTSYEAKAKASLPFERERRPARGRTLPSNLTSQQKASIRRYVHTLGYQTQWKHKAMLRDLTNETEKKGFQWFEELRAERAILRKRSRRDKQSLNIVEWEAILEALEVESGWMLYYH